MNAQRTSAEETERTLRAESVLSDDRLPVKWDGEYIYWADTWTDTMPFLCGVCGLTLVEEHPLNGGKETVWQLDESDYGPEGSHPVIQGELDI